MYNFHQNTQVYIKNTLKFRAFEFKNWINFKKFDIITFKH